MTDDRDSPVADEAPRTARPRWALPLMTGVAGFVFGVVVVGGAVGISAAVSAASKSSAADSASAHTKVILSKALKQCGMKDNASSDLADGGYTLTIDNQGNDDSSGVSLELLTCIEEALHTPESVTSHIGQTTSLDGRQTETWGRVTMSWSYHPDRGLDAVYTVKH